MRTITTLLMFSALACTTAGGAEFFVGTDREAVQYAALSERISASGLDVSDMRGSVVREFKAAIRQIQYRADKLEDLGESPSNAAKRQAGQRIISGWSTAAVWSDTSTGEACETATACSAFGSAVCTFFDSSMAGNPTVDGEKCGGKCEEVNGAQVLFRVRCAQ